MQNKVFTFLPKITVRQIALAGIFLALLTVFKLLDLAIPKINGYAAWEVYYTFGAAMVLVLPWGVSALVLFAAPFLWLAIGQTTLSGPWSIILDYFVPMLALIVVKFSFNKWAMPLFVILAGLIKFFSQSLSGKLFWDTNFVASMTFNFPFTAITTAISIALVFILFTKLKAIGKVSSIKSVRYYISTMTKQYVHDYKVLRRGYINKTVSFTLESKPYILKISNAKVNTLETEYKVVKVFFPGAILSNDKKALIRPFVAGEPVNELNESQKKNLTEKLEFFHSSDIALQPHNWNEYNRYRFFLKGKYFDKFSKLIEKYKDAKLVPSHNDVNMQNMVATSFSSVELLDFEWARLNHPIFDYASLYVYDGVLLRKGDVYDDTFQDFCFMIIVYSYLWTFSIPLSLKAWRLRKFFLEQLKNVKFEK